MALRQRNATVVKWDGQPKKISGILDAIDTGTNDRGTFKIYRSHDPERGARTVFFGTSRLDELFEPGDVGRHFELDYLGKVTTKRGTTAHTFNLAVDDAAPFAGPEQTKLTSVADSDPEADKVAV